jgi:hypothetical protein
MKTRQAIRLRGRKQVIGSQFCYTSIPLAATEEKGSCHDQEPVSALSPCERQSNDPGDGDHAAGDGAAGDVFAFEKQPKKQPTVAWTVD